MLGPCTGPDGNPLTAEAQKAWTATQGLSILVVPESPETTPDIVDEQSVFQILLAERAAREAGVLKPGCVGQVYGTQVAKQVSSLYPHFRCLAWGQLNALFTNQVSLLTSETSRFSWCSAYFHAVLTLLSTFVGTVASLMILGFYSDE